MALQVASPSSSPSLSFISSEIKYEYDVFLSFRGEDTRKSFTEPLYKALRRKGINAFIDDKRLGKGEEISPTLLKAIERSRISLIVFSKNYATSTWCLDELAHIVWCKNEKKQVAMPIFYKVNPLNVQYQTNSFEKAMTDLEEKFRDDLEKVRKWRFALSEAAGLSIAWSFEDGCDSELFIERIVEHAYSLLPPKRFHNIDHIVGLEPRIEEVMSLFDKSDDGVCMLGIYGAGGIGKTTLAKALYNSIFYHFEGACFLLDVREKSTKYQGIVRLQQTLLSEILEEKKMKFCSAGEGISRIKHRLSHKNVLLVLDDVDEIEQLEQLAGGCDWFGCGSKIIITTRNKQLLVACNIRRTYQMMELNEHDSLELFCRHAFHMSQPPKGYKNMSIHVTKYVHGLPLALKLIGSNLAQKSKKEWKYTLKQYDEIPERTIHHVLKISYDCLQDGAKRIFLDIACFFKEETLEFVEEILESCYYGTRFYVEVLVDKSLITIDDKGHLHMHDLIQQMGKEIVRQEAPLDLGKRSKLCYYKDVLSVLRKNSGGNDIEGIVLDPPQQEEVEWNGLAFEKMNNLRILVVRNTRFSTSPKYLPNSLGLLDWEGYPSMTLPHNFSPLKLVCFKLRKSHFKFEEQLQKFEYVAYMNFSQCEYIGEVPDLSHCQNLKTLDFNGCQNLIKVHDSVGSLRKLQRLDVGECTKLKSFPREINLPSLEMLTLSYCKSLNYFPHIVGKMDSIIGIYAEGSAIEELPPSIGNLHGLEELSIKSCRKLGELPNSLWTLKNLSMLELGGVQFSGRKSSIRAMQESQGVVVSRRNLVILDLENCGLVDEDVEAILSCFKNVQSLYVGGNHFESLPECIKECSCLEKLDLSNCKMLRNIPELPSTLQNIRSNNCTSLTTESISRLWSQAKKGFGVAISMPSSTKFPDWLDYCCEGGMVSFRIRGKNFPRLVVAFETAGKSNTRNEECFEAFISINGLKMPWAQSDDDDPAEGIAMEELFSIQGHVFLYNLLSEFSEQELKGLNGVLCLDYWNDVEIQVMCDSPNISIIKCGVYVDRLQANMDNVQFLSTTSLKRKAIASPLNKSAKRSS